MFRHKLARIAGCVVIGAIGAIASCGVQRTAPVVHFEPTVAPETEFDASLTAYIDSIARAHGDEYGFHGHIAVLRGNKIIYDRGFGFADRETQRKSDIDTSFRIGSVTKQFTAVAILQLHEAGKLRLQHPFGVYLKDFPGDYGDKVTIHQLLTHTAGIPNYTSFPAFMKQRDKPITLKQLVAVFAKRPLEFAPGSAHRYSNSGYALLGAIVEAVSGMTYGDYLAKHIFVPAGMTRTTYGDAPELNNRANGYRLDEQDKIIPAQHIDMSRAHAAGAIRSTIRDMMRWHRAIETDAILSPASRKAMYTPEKANYGYGVIMREINGVPAILHGGGIDGFITEYVRIPERDIVIVAWANLSSRPTSVGDVAAQMLAGKSVPPLQAPQAITQAQRDVLPGVYSLTQKSQQVLRDFGLSDPQIADAKRLEVVATARGLAIMRPRTGQKLPLRSFGPRDLTQSTLGLSLRFLPASGAVSKVKVSQGPVTIEFVAASPHTTHEASQGTSQGASGDVSHDHDTSTAKPNANLDGDAARSGAE